MNHLSKLISQSELYSILALKEEEWIVKEMDDVTDGSTYRAYVENMEWNEVYVDPHIENLLIFRGDADLHSYWMVVDGYVLLQDKVKFLRCFMRHWGLEVVSVY